MNPYDRGSAFGESLTCTLNIIFIYYFPEIQHLIVKPHSNTFKVCFPKTNDTLVVKSRQPINSVCKQTVVNGDWSNFKSRDWRKILSQRIKVYFLFIANTD